MAVSAGTAETGARNLINSRKTGITNLSIRARARIRSLYRRFSRSADMEIHRVLVRCITTESIANDYERPPEAGKKRRKLRRVAQIPSLE